MIFVFVAMKAELLDQGIGGLEGTDGFGGEERRQALLPVIVESLDFAFCLRGRSVAQGDIVEAQSCAELGKSFGRMSEEKGVIIDIKGQGQATGEEGAGKEVEMSQQRLPEIETSQRHHTTVVINDLDEVKRRVVLAKPAMR